MIGIGHVTRSLRLCRELLNRQHEIAFVLGGRPTSHDIEHPAFVLHQLPPLERDAESNEIVVPPPNDLGEDVTARIERRRDMLIDLVESTFFDIIVIEFFPFGRWRLKREILPMLDRAREVSAKCQVVCSIRDIIKVHDDYKTRDVKTAEVIQRYFDRVCVHSDPALFQLSQSFSRTDLIADRVVYTGFAVDGLSSDETPDDDHFKPTLLVSVGSGATLSAHKLLSAMASVVDRLCNFRIVIAMGNRLEQGIASTLKAQFTAFAHVTCHDLVPEFHRELAGAALSIGLGGSTVLEAITFGTRALVFATNEIEDQTSRVSRLAQLGFLRLIEDYELTEPELLIQIINNEANKPSPHSCIATNGIEQFADVVDKLVSEATGAQI